MKFKAITAALIFLFISSFASAQVTPDLQNKLDQKPDTSKVDVIIMTQSNSNNQAKQAVQNSNGNVSHDFDIIDGVAVTIPKVAAENLANRDFVREIQPDYNVATNLDESTQNINADDVWSNSTGENIDVAVLDTGIEDNTILNVEDQVDYTGEGTDDLNGHGTHVAGTVASTDDQYQGVAYGADLFDVKVLDGNGSGSASDVISGLEYAANNNLDVATLSLGAPVDTCDGTSSLSEAVDNTVEQGVTVTVAAGNQGPDSNTITAPGCAQKPITVGSSSNGAISDFSSRGPTADNRVKPDVVAPGESITSLTNNDGNSPQFETLSGTSMATPHVAGTAALLLSKNESLTPAQVKNITETTAVDLGAGENSQGSGRVDAYAAYQQVPVTQKDNQTGNETENNPPTIEALNTSVQLLNETAEATLTVNTSDTDNQSVNVSFYVDNQQVSTKEGIGKINYTESNLSLDTNYSWRAEATDGINTTTTQTQNFTTPTMREEENQPPTVEAVNTGVNIGNETANATLTINATDPDNTELNYTFNIDGETVANGQGYGEITHRETNLSLDTNYTWNAEASDSENTSTTQTVEFNTTTQKGDDSEESDNETRENQTSKPPLPSQASDTARKARLGFFNPNSPFYSLDVAFDQASVAVGLRTRESVMEERAEEAKTMAKRGNTKAAEKAVKNLRNTAGNTENASRQAQETLNNALQNSTEETQQNLQKALQNAEKERKERQQRQKEQTPNNQNQGENPGKSQQEDDKNQNQAQKQQPGNQQENNQEKQKGQANKQGNNKQNQGNNQSKQDNQDNQGPNKKTGKNQNKEKQSSDKDEKGNQGQKNQSTNKGNQKTETSEEKGDQPDNKGKNKGTKSENKQQEDENQTSKNQESNKSKKNTESKNQEDNNKQTKGQNTSNKETGSEEESTEKPSNTKNNEQKTNQNSNQDGKSDNQNNGNEENISDNQEKESKNNKDSQGSKTEQTSSQTKETKYQEDKKTSESKKNSQDNSETKRNQESEKKEENNKNKGSRNPSNQGPVGNFFKSILG